MTRNAFRLFLILVPSIVLSLVAQPITVSDGTRFSIDTPAQSVVLVGDFNGWSKSADPMMKDGTGKWSLVKKLPPATYQYAFLIDGKRVMRDPGNSMTAQDIERKRSNSLVTIKADRSVALEGYPPRQRTNDVYDRKGGQVYLNLVWRYHQPMYYDIEKDQITTPFVRIHGTKDYYDMAANVEKTPTVHLTASISPVLIWQIENIYVNRIKPFVHTKPTKARFDARAFYARYKGKTDPWIDLCLKPAAQFTDDDKALLYKSPWNVFATMTPLQISRFPEFMALYEKWKDAGGNPSYTEQEIRALKFWTIFGNFDPEFYERLIPLQPKLDVDFRDLVSFRSDGKYYLKHEITEVDCGRIIFDVYKVMASILPRYKKMKYIPRAKAGQIELAATSFGDAPLPLIINTSIAHQTAPGAPLPRPFTHMDDAEGQLRLGMSVYNRYFEHTPQAYVPAFGMISAAEVPLLAKMGFNSLAVDQSALHHSEPNDFTAYGAYSVSEGDTKMVGYFGDTELANRVNFLYRNYYAENAADDFIRYVLSLAPENPEEDRLVTVVMDGQSAWSWYQHDIDGQGFIHSLYRKLEAMFKSGRAIVTTTVSEYIDGNSDRGVRAHPITNLAAITKMGSGSRVHGNFSAWIGDQSTNNAWDVLGKVRSDFQNFGVLSPPDSVEIREGSKEWFSFLSLATMYAAESHSWFWFFGKEGTLFNDPKPVESIYLTLLKNVYTTAMKAGATASTPTLAPFIDVSKTEWTPPKKMTRVTFLCSLSGREAVTAVYIAGNRFELADQVPNIRHFFDNGEYGDAVAGDNVWTLILDIEEGPLQYKYTNSGGKGTWEGAESFPGVWRNVVIAGEKMTIDDTFGDVKE